MNLKDPLLTLRHLDPAAQLSDTLPLDPRAQADLQGIMSTHDSGRSRAGAGRFALRRLAVGALAAGVLAALIVSFGLPGALLGGTRPALAATPALQGFELRIGDAAARSLQRLAQRTQTSSSVAAGGEGDHLVRTESWSLTSSEGNDEPIRSAVVPELRELHWREDGSGTLRTVTGDPQFPDEESRRAWDEEGNPVEPGTVVASEEYGPGEFRTMYPLDLSSQPALLLEQLAVGHPIEQYGTPELFVAIEDLYLERLPSAGVRSAILALLAQRPDVKNLGRVNDRTGRQGIAFSVDSDYSGLPTRYIQIYNEADGRLLATEAILTERPGKLDVPVPSVIAYTTHLSG